MTKEYYKMNTENGTPLIQVDDFLNIKGIKHGFTTRVGGVSTGIYKSLNMGFYLGDDRENVMENYRRVGKAMGIDIERMSCPNQVHKSNVLVVTEEDAGDGITRDLSHFEIDAQITNVKDLPLIVYTADCVPILLADPVSRVIGTVHAGWRGSVAGIAAKTVHKMVEVYGCLPENIHAVIGPSIGPENYEVDQTVIDELFKCPYIDMSPENISYTDIFLESDDNWKEKLLSGQHLDTSNLFHKDIYVCCNSGSCIRDNMPEQYLGVTQTNKGAVYGLFRTVRFRKRYMLNLWNLNELVLVNAGLKISNIHQTKLCTMKNHDLFFSHRYTNGKRGLNAGIISL